MKNIIFLSKDISHIIIGFIRFKLHLFSTLHSPFINPYGFDLAASIRRIDPPRRRVSRMDADGNLARSVPGRVCDIMHIVSRTGTLSLTAQLPHHLAPTVCSLFFFSTPFLMSTEATLRIARWRDQSSYTIVKSSIIMQNLPSVLIFSQSDNKENRLP